MAVDAIAGRVNTLETSLMSHVEGKIMVVEEAVAARQNEQAKTNQTLNDSIVEITEKEIAEHEERVAKEGEIVSRVEVVEERVEGEIDDVRQRVERVGAEVKKEVQDLGNRVDDRCANTEDEVRASEAKEPEPVVPSKHY